MLKRQDVLLKSEVVLLKRQDIVLKRQDILLKRQTSNIVICFFLLDCFAIARNDALPKHSASLRAIAKQSSYSYANLVSKNRQIVIDYFVDIHIAKKVYIIYDVPSGVSITFVGLYFVAILAMCGVNGIGMRSSGVQTIAKINNIIDILHCVVMS